MGVIHKLKSEVIDFILLQKQQDPALGCRTLAQLASDKFSIVVSKSSVNSIIKSAQLSSPVGRKKSSPGGVKKFQIPIQKKEQILYGLIEAKLVSPETKLEPPAEMTLSQPVVKKIKIPGSELPTPRKKLVPKKIGSPKLRDDQGKNQKTEETTQATEVPVQTLSTQEVSVKSPVVEIADDKILARDLKPLAGGSQKIADKVGLEKTEEWEDIDNAGSFFLKAAEWSWGRGAMLKNFLTAIFSGPQAEKKAQMMEALMLLSAIGIESEKAVSGYHGQGIWKLIQAGPFSAAELILLQDENVDLAAAYWRLSSELSQVLTEVSCFSLQLQNRQLLSVGANFDSIWVGNVQKEAVSPMEVSMSNLSGQIINNLQPVLIRRFHEDLASRQAFYLLLGALEDFSELQISKISAVGRNSQELASFDFIPRLKRCISIGFGPEQTEFQRIKQSADGIDRRGSVNWRLGGKTIFYERVQCKLFQKDLLPSPVDVKVYYLKQADSGNPFWAILSNDSENRFSDDKIVLDYLDRWPLAEFKGGAPGEDDRIFWDQMDPFEIQRIENIAPEDRSWARLNALALNVLIKYTQLYFFPKHCYGNDLLSMRDRVFSLHGKLHQSHNLLKVRYLLNNVDVLPQDLQYAVQRVNAANIHTPQGQRLWFDIEL